MNVVLMEQKKIEGLKRHIVTDTRGHLLHVKAHTTNTHETVTSCTVFQESLFKYPSIKGVRADAGYRKNMERFVQNALKRTIAWLSKDYEVAAKSSENNTIIARSIVLLSRLK